MADTYIEVSRAYSDCTALSPTSQLKDRDHHQEAIAAMPSHAINHLIVDVARSASE